MWNRCSILRDLGRYRDELFVLLEMKGLLGERPAIGKFKRNIQAIPAPRSLEQRRVRIGCRSLPLEDERKRRRNTTEPRLVNQAEWFAGAGVGFSSANPTPHDRASI